MPNLPSLILFIKAILSEFVNQCKVIFLNKLLVSSVGETQTNNSTRGDSIWCKKHST